MPKDGGIGASSKRREDIRFLTGEGNYTDDINLRGQAHVFFLRSDIAHGALNSVDTSAADGMPGVVKIFTGADFAEVGGIPCGWQITDKHGEPMQEPRHPVLADGKVRHVGEPIAAVVAETLSQARDAAEAIVVDITDLPAVVDMKQAVKDGAPKVHDDLTSNLCYDWGFVEENKGAVDKAFEDAAHVTTLELVNNRLVANPMEPRVAVGDYARRTAITRFIPLAEPACDPPADGGLCSGHPRTQAARCGPRCGRRLWHQDFSLSGRGVLHLCGQSL